MSDRFTVTIDARKGPAMLHAPSLVRSTNQIAVVYTIFFVWVAIGYEIESQSPVPCKKIIRQKSAIDVVGYWFQLQGHTETICQFYDEGHRRPALTVSGSMSLEIGQLGCV